MSTTNDPNRNVPPDPATAPGAAKAPHPHPHRRRLVMMAAVLLVMAIVTFGLTALLVTIFEHKQEARTPFVRLVEVSEVTSDPAPWGVN